VGIAFQSLKHEDAENIGYIIPTPVIHHFTTDYERNGAYTGFPCLGVEWQKMENPDLRTALRMKVVVGRGRGCGCGRVREEFSRGGGRRIGGTKRSVH
jgi:hypothetical protein